MPNKPAKIAKAITEINAFYEAAFLKHVGGTDVSSVYEIDLAEPFFGTGWGVVEVNTQRQKWRWLGPFGQSHLYLKLSPDTDHLVRAYIHTAASGQVLESLTASVNGQVCARQGHDWGADGVATHWCIVDRDLVAKRDGVARITWNILSSQKRPVAGPPIQPSPYSLRGRGFMRRALHVLEQIKFKWGSVPQVSEPHHDSGEPPFSRLVAFSRIVCEPYPLPRSAKNS